MRRKFGFLLSLALIAALLGACSEKEEHEDSSKAFPVTVKAGNGDVEIPNQPTKIVSLSPTATEMLFAIGAGPQTVAVDDQSSFPQEAPRTSLSGFTPNAEAVLGYQPNLVVVSNDTNNIVASLKAANVPVLVEPAAMTINDVYDQMIDLGEATGNKEKAVEKTDEMRSEMRLLTTDLEHKSDHPSYYYELDNTYFSVTSASFVGSIFSMFGLENIADSANSNNAYPQLSAESIILSNPDMVFLADSKCCGQNATTVAQRPGWSNINAVKSSSVFTLDDDVASRWGPRVVDLTREINKAVKAHEVAAQFSH